MHLCLRRRVAQVTTSSTLRCHVRCSSEFALRPYLYLLIHWPIVKLASLLTTPGHAKYLEFFALRIVLSLLSATLEIRLVRYAQTFTRA